MLDLCTVFVACLYTICDYLHPQLTYNNSTQTSCLLAEKIPEYQSWYINEYYIMPLLISGSPGYFGGCGLFIELDDDIDDLEKSLASQTTLNDSLAEFGEELIQFDSSINTPCPDNSSGARWVLC